MQVIVLCGGKGTRAYPFTSELPKPLLQVGGQPILRHILDLYASNGVSEFVLAAGYRADVIEGFARGLGVTVLGITPPRRAACPTTGPSTSSTRASRPAPAVASSAASIASTRRSSRRTATASATSISARSWTSTSHTAAARP